MSVTSHTAEAKDGGGRRRGSDDVSVEHRRVRVPVRAQRAASADIAQFSRLAETRLASGCHSQGRRALEAFRNGPVHLPAPHCQPGEPPTDGLPAADLAEGGGRAGSGNPFGRRTDAVTHGTPNM